MRWQSAQCNMADGAPNTPGIKAFSFPSSNILNIPFLISQALKI